MKSEMLIGVFAIGLVSTMALAEDNAGLLKARNFGAVTGEPERDSIGYAVGEASDLSVRFEKDEAPGVVGSTSPHYLGKVSGNAERDSFGY